MYVLWFCTQKYIMYVLWWCVVGCGGGVWWGVEVVCWGVCVFVREIEVFVAGIPGLKWECGDNDSLKCVTVSVPFKAQRYFSGCVCVCVCVRVCVCVSVCVQPYGYIALVAV